MGVWNVATPAGSDNAREGDDRIREMKVALEEALQAEGGFPGVAPTTAPKYIWTGTRGNTASRPSAPITNNLYFNTQLKRIEYWTGAAWANVDTIPGLINVDETMITASVAGNGLAGGAGTALSVNVGTGLEISSDAVRIAAAAAGDGLTGGAGSALAVNVDNSTIEINTDALRVKSGGISSTQLSTGVNNTIIKTGARTSIAIQNDGANVYFDAINHTGPGRLKGVGIGGTNAGLVGVQIVIDGVTYGLTQNSLPEWYVEESAGLTLAFSIVTASFRLDSLNIFFNTSLQVRISSSAASVGQSTLNVNWEHGT